MTRSILPALGKVVCGWSVLLAAAVGSTSTEVVPRSLAKLIGG